MPEPSRTNSARVDANVAQRKLTPPRVGHRRHRTSSAFGTESDNGSFPGMGHGPLPPKEIGFCRDDRARPWKKATAITTSRIGRIPAEDGQRQAQSDDRPGEAMDHPSRVIIRLLACSTAATVRPVQ
jgi:hypothetical protein